MSSIQKCFPGGSRYTPAGFPTTFPDDSWVWEVSCRIEDPIKIKEDRDFCLCVFWEKTISSSQISTCCGHSFTANSLIKA